jgi:hypothetical protein
MLGELEKLFESKFATCKQEVKHIPKSCCNAIDKIEFHFDDVTKEFFKTVKVGDLLKSVDVIHFASKNNELLFFEMIGFRDYAARTGKNTNKDCLEFVRNQLTGVDNVRHKLIHSIFTIVKIIDYYEMDKTFYSYFFDKRRLRIKSYIVLDLTYDEYIFIEFSCLDKLQKHKKNRIEGMVNILNCPGFLTKLNT